MDSNIACKVPNTVKIVLTLVVRLPGIHGSKK